MRDEYKIQRQGKTYVLYAGLLEEAHNKGLKEIDTFLHQIPSAENGNVAVVLATVVMEDEKKFTGIGDASPENVGRNIAPHLIRMAETRAKARALRDAVNVAEAMLDDAGIEDDSHEAPAQRQKPEPSNVSEIRVEYATKIQQDQIWILVEDVWPEKGKAALDRILEQKSVDSLEKLTKREANGLIQWLTAQADKPGATS